MEKNKTAKFRTNEEYVAYSLGREHEAAATIDFINKWDGEQNSAMGRLLHRACTRLTVIAGKIRNG